MHQATFVARWGFFFCFYWHMLFQYVLNTISFVNGWTVDIVAPATTINGTFSLLCAGMKLKMQIHFHTSKAKKKILYGVDDLQISLSKHQRYPKDTNGKMRIS